MQVTESLPSTPGADVPHPEFYSDGRPRPVHRDGDEESRDSFEDGGYTTAAPIPPTHHFTDPDQPKLLLAEDPVPPMREKQPLQDSQGTLDPAQCTLSTAPTFLFLAHLPPNGGHEGGCVPYVVLFKIKICLPVQNSTAITTLGKGKGGVREKVRPFLQRRTRVTAGPERKRKIRGVAQSCDVVFVCTYFMFVPHAQLSLQA